MSSFQDAGPGATLATGNDGAAMAQQELEKLSVEFATQDTFLSEYASNICNGGIFIHIESGLVVGDLVEVELRLEYCEQSVRLEGEVVHSIPTEMAQAGAAPGVAIQFALSASDLRRKFQPYVGDTDFTNERRTGSGRREARRVRARVQAEVEDANGGAYDTRTRDLSRTGALVSAGTCVPALGESVSLNLSHPVTGKAMKVDGSVVRHVLAESGEVAALGIEFRLTGADASEVGEFVEDVKATEHSRHLGAICGPIDPLGVRSLLVMFAGSAPHGTLTLIRGNEEGTIVINQGAFVTAYVGARSGFSALGEMLEWDSGRFEFETQLDAALMKESGIPLEQVIRRVESGAGSNRTSNSRKRKKRRPTGHSVSTSASVRVDYEAFDAAGPELSKLEGAVIDLAIAGMKISKMVRVIPESEVEILEAIANLLEQGLVRID